MMKTTVAVAGVFAVLLCSQSAVGAPKSSDAKNSGKSVATPAEKSYIGSKDAKFSKQDAALKQAENLVKQEKFEPAIDMYKRVKSELENEAGWKAGLRLKEVSARLKVLQLQFGNVKLAAAEKAIRESRYNTAITLANEAAQACEELIEAANRIKTSAVIQQKSDAVKKSISPDTVIPDLKNKEKMIANYIAEAKVLLKHRRYEDARRRVEEVFKLNPFNQEAAYIVSQIYSEYYTAGYHRSIADMRAMLAVEEWSWVEPVFYQKASGESDNPSSTVRVAGDQAIQQKLDKIILPEVSIPGQSVVAALLAVRRLSQQHDPDYRDELSDDERGKLGVIIDFSVPGTVETAVAKPANQGQNGEDGEENAAPAADTAAAQPTVDVNDIEVNFNVKNASLRDVLDYISFLTDLPYHVTPTRVVFGTRSADIRKHVFEVSADAVARITGDTGNVQATEAGGDAEGENEDSAALATQQQSEVTINSEDLKTFFKEFGISFDAEGSAINYANGKLTMFNTPENIQRMSDTLAKLNTTKQLIQIELKSIELSEEDCEDLGFEWSISSSSTHTHNSAGSTTVGQGDYAVLGGPVSFLGNAVGRTGSLLNGLNLFPDLFGSWKPFGIDQTLNISLTIQALDQNERSETISAPQVTVADGQQATIKLNTTYFFPNDWEELEVDFETSDGDTIRTVTPPMPEFGDETKIGTTLVVKPTIRNNKIINLHLEPTIAAWVGKDTETIEAVFGDRAGNGEWNYHTENYEIWKPQIATRNFVVDVNVYDGETLVIGGLASSELETRLDKIPVLGDLPLIGRLFQRQSEKSIRSNMLFFVTARLLNEGGAQVNRIQNSGGIPDVNR